MIAGVGVDIVETSRFRRLVERYGAAFLERHFAAEEIRQCQGSASPDARFAQTFAAKEAVLKALSLCWHRGVFWKEITVLEGCVAPVTVALSGQARTRAAALGISTVFVSTVDAREYAIAMAIATARDPSPSL